MKVWMIYFTWVDDIFYWSGKEWESNKAKAKLFLTLEMAENEFHEKLIKVKDYIFIGSMIINDPKKQHELKLGENTI